MSESQHNHNRSHRFLSLRSLGAAAALATVGFLATFGGHASFDTLASTTPQPQEIDRVKTQEAQVSAQAVKEHPDPSDPQHYAGDEVVASLNMGKVFQEVKVTTMQKIEVASAVSFVGLLGLTGLIAVAAQKASQNA